MVPGAIKNGVRFGSAFAHGQFDNPKDSSTYNHHVTIDGKPVDEIDYHEGFNSAVSKANKDCAPTPWNCDQDAFKTTRDWLRDVKPYIDLETINQWQEQHK